jgi:hypothetical protein
MKLLTPLFPVRFLALGAFLLATASCSVSEQVKDAPSTGTANTGRPPAQSPKEIERENKSYEQVLYRLNFVDEARLGGQDILFVRQASDLTSPQQAKLQAALQSGALPLKMRMRVYARNSSKENIQLKQLDYQLLLDGKEWLSGRTGAAVDIEPSSIVTLPVNVDMNLTPAMLKGSTPAAFAAGLADFTGTNRRLTMVIRPSYESTTGRVTKNDDYQPIELITAKR